jgi:hypothetical protein
MFRNQNHLPSCSRKKDIANYYFGGHFGRHLGFFKQEVLKSENNLSK